MLNPSWAMISTSTMAYNAAIKTMLRVNAFSFNLSLFTPLSPRCVGDYALIRNPF